MSKIGTIGKAWIEVLKGKTTKIQKQRAEICANCPSSQHKKYLEFFKEELREVKGMVCIECGCPLSAKIRSEDTCPKKLW